MLLSKVQKVDHPYEVGQWFEFRGLSWVQLADARSQASAEQREIVTDPTVYQTGLQRGPTYKVSKPSSFEREPATYFYEQ